MTSSPTATGNPLTDGTDPVGTVDVSGAVGAPPEPEKDTPEWYRQNLAKANERTAAAQQVANTANAKLRTQTFKAVDLDPERGVGKSIAERWDGEPDDVAGLVAFANEEYELGLSVPDEAAGAAQDAVDVKTAQVVAGSQPQTPPADVSLDQQIANAEEAAWKLLPGSRESTDAYSLVGRLKAQRDGA